MSAAEHLLGALKLDFGISKNPPRGFLWTQFRTAGENGALGTGKEQDVIKSVCRLLRSGTQTLAMPSADTLFHAEAL